MTEKVCDAEKLQLALGSIYPQDEYFLDYLSVTSGGKRCIKKRFEENAELNEHCETLGKAAVGQAQHNLIEQDIPFRPPTDFTGEMFRPDFILTRLKRIQEKKEEEMEMQQQIRRRRMEKQHQIALQHGKRMGKHAQTRMQREIIDRWKDERKRLADQGCGEKALPTLEEIEKKYAKERKVKRQRKNAKFGGTKTKQKALRSLSKGARKAKRDE